jgi:glutathione S-transferase
VDVTKAEQWIAFMQGDLTPCGTNNVRFYRFLPQKHSFPLQLFHREGLRIFGILDTALEGRDYLVGAGKGKFSVADIANFTYVNNSFFIGIGPLDRWPNLKAWQQRIWARPAVKRGVDVPYPAISTNEVFEKKIAEDPDFKKLEESLSEALRKAMDEFPPMGPPK